MKKHYDWKGNEIKSGDTICVIFTRRKFTKFGIFIPGTGETIMAPEIDGRCWDNSERYLVSEDEDGWWLTNTYQDGTTIHTPINQVVDFIDNDRTKIGIVGISDMEPIITP
jgi:hypothetical protein